MLLWLMVNGNSSSSRVPKASLDALLKSLDESLAVRGLQGMTVNVLPHLQQAGANACGRLLFNPTLVSAVFSACRAEQAATLLDQACSNDDMSAAAKANSSPPVASSDAAKQQQLVLRASKALLKQVEETRHKYTAEVEGLKSELQLLGRQAQKDRREADLASVTAGAAKKAALEATEELERLNDEVLRAKRTLQQLHRCVSVAPSTCV